MYEVWVAVMVVETAMAVQSWQAVSLFFAV